MITTYEHASRLKGIGYNRKETAYYLDDRFIESCRENWNGILGIYTSAPSVSDAIQWIRDEKEIDCVVSYYNKIFSYHGKPRAVYCFKFGKDGKTIYNSYNVDDKFFVTFPAAESALLDALLTYLEEQK